MTWRKLRRVNIYEAIAPSGRAYRVAGGNKSWHVWTRREGAHSLWVRVSVADTLAEGKKRAKEREASLIADAITRLMIQP